MCAWPGGYPSHPEKPRVGEGALDGKIYCNFCQLKIPFFAGFFSSRSEKILTYSRGV
jgi:hypothetical protein